MKRSVGLTLVGVLVILLSALSLLLDALGITGLFLVPPTSLPPSTIPGQPDPRVFAIFGLVFWLMLSGFGIVNGIGLIKRWMWCRYATIVFGFLAAGISVFSSMVIALMPFPPTPGVNDQFMHGMRTVMVGFYLFWFALFLAMSLFLLRKKIGEEFRGATTSEPAVDSSPPDVTFIHAPEPRPILVWIVAGFQLLGVIGLPMMFFMKTPTFFMGMVFTDVPAKIVISAWSIAALATGIALLRSIRSAFWVALGIYLLAACNSLVTLLPGPSVRFFQLMEQYFPQPMFIPGLMRLMLVIGSVVSLVPLVLLVVGRERYFEWCKRRSTLPLANT